MKLAIRASVLLLLLPLSGCSYFSNASVTNAQDKNYLSARSVPPLRIPPGVSTTSLETDYPVSDKSFPVSELKVDLTPPGLNG